MKEEKKEPQKQPEQEIENEPELESQPEQKSKGEEEAKELAKAVQEDKIAPRKVRVAIKSLPYNGRYGAKYRAHSVQEIDEDEALQLIEAGIADPFSGISKTNFGKIETQSLDVTKLAEGVKSAQLGKA